MAEEEGRLAGDNAQTLHAADACSDHPAPDQPAGVLAASMVGTVATLAAIAGPSLIESPSNGGSTVGFLIFAFPFAWVVWLFGIVFLGLPVWALLENRVASRRFAAAATGAVLVGGVWGLVGASVSAILDFALPGALCGALAGLMFEGAAYRGWCLYKALKGEQARDMPVH